MAIFENSILGDDCGGYVSGYCFAMFFVPLLRGDLANAQIAQKRTALRDDKNHMPRIADRWAGGIEGFEE